jgi:sugar phosphate isomerase/epimerase
MKNIGGKIMQLGAQLYTVRDLCQTEQDFAQTMTAIARIGYKTVQISGVSASIPAAAIRRICDENDLKIIVTHTPPQKILNETEQVIADHKTMGAKYVGLGMMPMEYLAIDPAKSVNVAQSLGSAADTRRFIADFAPAIAKIYEAGLKFVYHNHHFEFEKYDGKSVMDIMLDGFVPEQVGILLDTFWLQYSGNDPISWIKKMSGRLSVVHLKDLAIINSLAMTNHEPNAVTFAPILGRQQVMAPVGSGNMNFPGIIEACAAAGTEYLMVEQDICQGDPLDALKQSYEYLSNLGFS